MVQHIELLPSASSRPSAAVRAKIQDLGLNTVAKYAVAGRVCALCHSLMEEYYWRWFVFGRGFKPAIDRWHHNQRKQAGRDDTAGDDRGQRALHFSTCVSGDGHR